MKREYGMLHKQKHYVYRSKEDFENHNLELHGIVPPLVKNWRKAEEGDWVIADDNGIVQILRKGVCKSGGFHRRNYNYFRTIVGTFVNSKWYLMDTDMSSRVYPEARYRWPGAKRKTLWERIAKRQKLTRKERYFCIRVATGNDPIEMYQEIYGATNLEKVATIVHLLLKQDRIMSTLTELIADAAKEAGVTHKSNFERHLEIFNNSKDDKIKLEVSRDLRDMIGTSVQEERKGIPLGMLAGGFRGFLPKELEKADPDRIEPAKPEDNGKHKST